jgi:hemolysin III
MTLLNKLREPVSGLTHLGAAVVAAIGCVGLLILGRGNVYKEISLLVYGTSLVLMFCASAAYHLVKAEPRVVLVLRKLDHAAIYLLIAGTYTPICLHYFNGFWRWGLLGIIWGLALLGIVIKFFMINAPRWLTTLIYLIMGWMAILGTREMLASLPVGALLWLLFGGVFFTSGAIIYMLKRPDFYPGIFGFHELWHIFVILGCLSHFIVVAAYIAPPA